MASASVMAFSHGMGDAQKSMGIIGIAMVAYTAGRAGVTPGSFLYKGDARNARVTLNYDF